jgi:hypothetical protein
MKKVSSALALVASAGMLLVTPALAADCVGDDCQVPPAPPDDAVPATMVVEGPSNPPVRFPKTHRQKKNKKHHKKTAGERRTNRVLPFVHPYAPFASTSLGSVDLKASLRVASAEGHTLKRVTPDKRSG